MFAMIAPVSSMVLSQSEMLWLLLAVGIGTAGLEGASCDAVCERRAAEALLASGDERAAVESLKNARESFPDDRGLALLLARAYLLEENFFWAERTVADALRRWPDDPEILAWMAAVHLRQGDPELAAEDLEPGLEPGQDPLRARWQLLAASQARLVADDEHAASLVKLATGADSVYPEDLEVLRTLRSNLDPWWGPVLSGSLDLGGGHTSNALAGSPTDPGEGGPASGLVLPELRVRFAPLDRGVLRPVVDLEVLGNLVTADEAEDFSTLLGGIRLGGMVAAARHRLVVGYRAEGLHVEGESALYSEAHRGELELEWSGGRVLFGGVGHRSYTDEKRTRWEGDLGFGGSLGSIGRAPVVAGATLRVADAESEAYDLLGVSAAASTVVPLGRRCSLRLALSAAWDDYLHSGGSEGRAVFGTEDKRRDLLGRIGATFWAPEWRHLRPGIELRATRRASTADETPGFDFSYSEWRAMVWLRWTFAAGNRVPSVSTPSGHVPLDWGVERGGGMEEERILDLLRRDEELRRGSSCTIQP